MNKPTWTIIYRGAQRIFLCNGREVPEHFYRLNNPSRMQEIIDGGTVRMTPPRDAGWEYENGGRGRYIGQLGRENDPRTYHRSRESAKEEARRQGFTVIEDA